MAHLRALARIAVTQLNSGHCACSRIRLKARDCALTNSALASSNE
jgi:hypothetical protein